MGKIKVNTGATYRDNLKNIKKFKRKQWLARKKDRVHAMHYEERRQKFLKEQQLQIDDAPAEPAVQNKCNTTVATRNEVSNAFQSSRCLDMVKTALDKIPNPKRPKISNPETKKADEPKRQIHIPAVGTEKATTRRHNSKELDPSLISRLENVKALGKGTFGVCYLAKYRNILVAAKEYLDKDGRMTLAKLQREADVIQSIGDHKGLPFLFGMCTQAKPVQNVLLYHGDDNKNLTI